MPWVVIILVYPLAGAMVYLFIGRSKKNNKLIKQLRSTFEEGKEYFVQDPAIREEIYEKDYDNLKYIMNFCEFPVTKNNEVTYYRLGDEGFPVMLEELKKAKKFIFMEYFIINKGRMWDQILEILEAKVKEGVEVRVMYDDFGSVTRLSKSYPQKLEKKGIKCITFNQLQPFGGAFMNNRDHRKILVIDGKVGFTGGINISDEYINLEHPFGHWKDNCIRIKGNAVWNFTVMFLEMWNSYKNDDDNYLKYKVLNKEPETPIKGYVVPYGDTPLDNEVMAEDIYLNIIHSAKHYVYIFTPYLVIDTDIMNALILASRRGVDVRLVVPGIPDKKIVYDLTQSYFPQLISGGVRIYTYTPGFVHSKVFVSDDKVATVGTINLDYRSLYLHFECGVYMQDVAEIKNIRNDIEETMKKSYEVGAVESEPSWLRNLGQSVLRLFAPLM